MRARRGRADLLDALEDRVRRGRLPLGGARRARRPCAEGGNALSRNTVEPEQHLACDISYIPMFIKHKGQWLVWNASMQCSEALNTDSLQYCSTVASTK